MALVEKNILANVGDIRDMGLIPGLGRCPGGVHGNSPPVFLPRESMDRGAWWATVHRVAKRQTQLKPLSMHACIVLPKIARVDLFTLASLRLGSGRICFDLFLGVSLEGCTLRLGTGVQAFKGIFLGLNPLLPCARCVARTKLPCFLTYVCVCTC